MIQEFIELNKRSKEASLENFTSLGSAITKMVYISWDYQLPNMINNQKVCKKVYQGKKDYFKYTFHLLLSAAPRIPPLVKEKIEYLVLRFIETRQRRPFDVWEEWGEYRLEPLDPFIPPKPTTISFLMPIARVWIWGTAISILSICAEFIYRHLRNKTRNHGHRKLSNITIATGKIQIYEEVFVQPRSTNNSIRSKEFELKKKRRPTSSVLC